MASITFSATGISESSGFHQESKESTVEWAHPFSEPWEDSDLVLVVEDEKFHVHRQILSIHSPVFKAMLGTKFKEATAKEIPLPGKNADQVLDFLKQLYLKESNGVTLDKVEHLLKLADEYQTKSVFNVCVNLLKNEVAGSKEKAISILYLANTTDMARTDERLDVVRKECYDYIKGMALQKIMEKEDFKNLEQDVRENVLVKRIEKLEELVKEVHPQFNDLVNFCVTLCLESSKHCKKVTRCPMHCNIDSRATRPPFTQFKTCTVCEKMVRELSSLLMSSASNRSKQPGGSSPFGGNLSYLHLIFQDLQRVYNDIVMSHNRYTAGGLCFSFGGGLLKP